MYAKTGIRKDTQLIYYNNTPLSEKNIDSVPSGSNLTMSVALVGGGANCEICYENGTHICHECQEKIFCSECCTKFHKHPSRSSHNPIILNSSELACAVDSEALHNDPQSDTSTSVFPWDDDRSDSPGTNETFMEASMVMTLAEKFDMTRFKDYQKETIRALQCRTDCLVIQPTGSGKSLCFQFPAVHENKIAVVITPTISLMQDHVKNCETLGISAAYFGSAQLDLQAEKKVLSTDSDVRIIFITPERIAKDEKNAKLRHLIDSNRVCLIALDEAHLFHYWQEFQVAYKKLEHLKTDFPSVPLLCLTATAPPLVKESVCTLLRNPVICCASIDRPNILLRCEEIPSCIRRKDFSYFASRVANILNGSESAIIYTDFIEDVGPITSELNDVGIDTVAYYGEMDIRSRNESFEMWRTGEIKVMVATSAFGMGINKANIRHII